MKNKLIKKISNNSFTRGKIPLMSTGFGILWEYFGISWDFMGFYGIVSGKVIFSSDSLALFADKTRQISENEKKGFIL